MFRSKYPDHERKAMERKLSKAIEEKFPGITGFGYQIKDDYTTISIFEEENTLELRTSLEKKYKTIIDCWEDFSEWTCGEYKLRVPTNWLYDEIFTINDFKL